MNKIKELKRINIEDIIWIIYLFIIFFNLYSNKLEKQYVLNNDKVSHDKFISINKSVLTIILVIYLYFLFIAIEDYIEKPNDLFNKLTVLAALLFVISGALTLYIVSNNNSNDDEIPII